MRDVRSRQRRQDTVGVEHPAPKQMQAQHIDDRVVRLVHEHRSLVFFEILIWRDQGTKSVTSLRYRVTDTGRDNPGKGSQILEVELDGTLLIVVLSLAMAPEPKYIGQIHSRRAFRRLEPHIDDVGDICEDHQAQRHLSREQQRTRRALPKRFEYRSDRHFGY